MKRMVSLFFFLALFFVPLAQSDENVPTSLVQYILSVNQPGKPGTFDPKFAMRALVEALSCGELADKPASNKVNFFKQIFAAISDQNVRINNHGFDGFVLKGTGDYQGFIGGLGAWVAIGEDGTVVSGRLTGFSNIQDFVANAPKTLEELKGLPGNTVNPPRCSAEPFEGFASSRRPPALPSEKCVMSTRPASQLAVASASAAASAVSSYAQFMAVQAYLGTLKEIFDTATALSKGMYVFGFADSSLTALPDDWSPVIPDRPFTNAAAMTLWYRPATGGAWKPVRANFLLMPQGTTASVVHSALVKAGISSDELLRPGDLTFSPFYVNQQGNRVTDVGYELRRFDEERGCYKIGSMPYLSILSEPQPLHIQQQMPYTPAEINLAAANAANASSVVIQEEARPAVQISCDENLNNAERLLSMLSDPAECYDIVQYNGVGAKIDLIIDYLNECKAACAKEVDNSKRREELGERVTELQRLWHTIGNIPAYCDIVIYGAAPAIEEEVALTTPDYDPSFVNN